MKSQTIIWTPLPNGKTVDNKLKISVLVSPRLETNEILPGNSSPILKQFPDFIDWHPEDIGFDIHFEHTNTVFKAQIVSVSEPRLWTKLFNESTPVSSYMFDERDIISRNIRSFPMTRIHTFLKEQYQMVATISASTLPSNQLLGSPSSFGQLDLDSDRNRNFNVLKEELEQKLNQNQGVIPPLSPDEIPDMASDFAQLRIFHSPHNHVKQINAYPNYTQYKRADIKKPRYDFHKVISILSNYPQLMRHFELVFDLEVTVSPELAETTIWVVPKWPKSSNIKNVTPKVRVTKGFRVKARESTGHIQNGMLDLSRDLYEVIQVDVDGAAIKVMNLAASINRSLLHKTADTPDTFSLPSLRTAGISVVEKDLAYRLKNILNTAGLNNETVVQNNSGLLYAEDIFSGFRVDVYDILKNKWYSLCDRLGTYKFLENAYEISKDNDEGYLSLGVTESATGLVETPSAPAPDLYVTESLFRWNGWSLSVPRPTTRLNFKNEPENYVPDPSSSLDKFKLQASFFVKKGSLPRLRFGNSYKFRIRTVDLAGNSLSLNEADFKYATQELTYRRFEPVSFPTIVLPNLLTSSPGESTEHMVVRTINNVPENDTPDPDKIKPTRRHIAPPIGAQSLAEQHGKFDTPSGLDKGAYQTIIKKEGSFKQFHPESRLDLQYLPDPLCRGAAFLGLPGRVESLLGFPGALPNKEIQCFSDVGSNSMEIKQIPSFEKPLINLVKVDFRNEEAWPEARPFILELKGILNGKAVEMPKWDPASRILAVQVPQAQITKVRLSSYIYNYDLDLMALWDMIKTASLTNEQLAETGLNSKEKLLERIKYYALQGRDWMLTPYREIVLVHAVQQPLGIPAFFQLGVTKQIGNTYAILHDYLKVHVKSTGKIEMMADWNEVIDALNAPGPEYDNKRQSIAFGLPLDYPDPMNSVPESSVKINHAHEFGDTKYRKVNYTIIATSRFQDYFEKGTETIRKSEVVTVDIPSSARPAAPKILYVIPTFRWNRSFKDGVKIESKRIGGGLRVYLERPWFSSGEGELLGVVIAKAKAKKQSPKVPSEFPKNFVSERAIDPLWKSMAPSTHPVIEDFISPGIVTEDNLTLKELSDGEAKGYSIAVIGHKVVYDAGRKLWYCDIDLKNDGNYFPFIRMALARYQPHSIKTLESGKRIDVKLSPIMLSDFIQLLPDRSVSITINPRNRKILTVIVTGIKGRGKVYDNEIKISVEKRDLRFGKSELGWSEIPGIKIDDVQRTFRNSLYHKEVTLPELSKKNYRIVIKEWEIINKSMGEPGPIKGSRLVYAEILKI